MSLVSMLSPNGPSGFGNHSTAEEVSAGLALGGKTYLVTGCNSGLGMETLRVLALRGARVVGAARTAEKARATAHALGLSDKVIPLAVELSDPASVRAAVAQVKAQGLRLDGVICNAGIMALPKLQLIHGLEAQFFTNHIGHFLLVTGLLDQLTDDARVVTLSSTGHLMAPKGGIAFDNLDGAKGYSAWRFYGQSKFADLLFAKSLARRFAGTARTANAVHPGVITTNLTRHMASFQQVIMAGIGPIFFKTIPQGAATQVYVATHPATAKLSGLYFADSNVKKPRADAEDPATADRLWEVSEKIIAGL